MYFGHSFGKQTQKISTKEGGLLLGLSDHVFTSLWNWFAGGICKSLLKQARMLQVELNS
jgi:hypothetical protein